MNNTASRSSQIIPGFLSVIIPVLGAVTAIIIGNILLMDYIHVLIGAIWTGTDVFLGLIFSQVLRNITPAMQRDVMQRLLPMTMFFIPTATILTIAVGYFLASAERIFSLESTIFMAIVTIGLVLAVITFAIIFPSSLRIASLIRQEKAADNEVSRFIHRISLGCLSQLFFQVVMISLMAYLVVYQ